MVEDEVNVKCKEWLENKGLKYHGILNKGLGQVSIPLPNGERQVLIDHQGFSDKSKELVWIEAKGSNCGLSQLLEGFIRVCLAVYYGGGVGYLAVPRAEYKQLMEIKDFLEGVIQRTNDKDSVMFLDVEKG